jgi:hypothetical protein
MLLSKLGLTKDELKEKNNNGEFPDIPTEWMDYNRIRIQLEAGQHRSAALVILFPNDKEEWWWVICLYERPLSVVALDHLRANDSLYKAPLDDGERFLHCYSYLELMEGCDRSDEGLQQKEM